MHKGSMSSLVRVTGVRFRLARRLEGGLGLARGLRDEFRLARPRRGGVSLTRRPRTSLALIDIYPS